MKAIDARVLLTGASGGIGRAASRMLVEAGACVMLVGRSPERLFEQARALKAKSDFASKQPQIEWYAANLALETGRTGLAKAAAEWGCNVVVHGAGTPGFGRLEAFDADEVTEIVHMNLLVPVLPTQAMLPRLRSLPEARIVFVGSVLGRLGLPGYSVYGASKFGLRGFAEALRRELGGTSVGVQYLGPRSTRTAFNSQAATEYIEATGTAVDEPQVVAAALLELLKSGAPERFLGFPEKLAVRLNGLVPAWLDGAFAKHRASLPAITSSNELVIPAVKPDVHSPTNGTT